MFEKILVPLDGSEHSIRALENAIQLAKKFKGRITALHVYSVSVALIMLPEPTTLGSPGIPYLTAAEVSKVTEASREAGNRILGARSFANARDQSAKKIISWLKSKN
jgi:nucleotide-binding universal stress UspA family protein